MEVVVLISIFRFLCFMFREERVRRKEIREEWWDFFLEG